MKIIQFIHPGGEHNLSSGTNWNKESHKRKYLELSGNYVADLNLEPKNSSQLFFWGEWEAPSNGRKINDQVLDGPNYIFKPYYNLPIPPKVANTDPFMLGSQFYYCICKQGHYPSLRNLQPQDILLFGSCKNSQFILDSVFVIKNATPYQLPKINELKDSLSNTFFDVSLKPLNNVEVKCAKNIKEIHNCLIAEIGDNEDDNCPVDSENEYFIYEAVMYEDKENFNGMFSYSPCLTGSKGQNGFARPIINLPQHISPNLNQGLKITEVDDSYSIWKQVTDMVLSEDLSLMISNQI